MAEARIRAPEFPNSLHWFNTAKAVTLGDVRGRVVLLHFWSYCSIHCLHVLEELRHLEEKYKDKICVIGIHSPKYTTERNAAHLQKALNRHHVRHPVVNDPPFQLWRTYGIKAWPSILVIDTQGMVVGVMRGEGRYSQLDELIGTLLREGEAAGLAPGVPIPMKYHPETRATLSFPGKVLATENLLYIADSGRNRILETYHDGSIRRVFGSNTAGFLDGNLQDAAFDSPQGMVKVDDFLYVADAGNHAIRRIGLKRGDVDTFAGTGKQGRYTGRSFDKPREAALNSPWDLDYRKGILYVAMAGQHQIWAFNLAKQTLEVMVGSGREDLQDGPLQAACLAQPCGLAMGEREMYLVDAETSAIRAVDLNGQQIHTLVGSGLFEFGDVDGPGSQARLQHPLGICLDEAQGHLWIADTLNSKIKVLTIKSNAISSLGINLPLNEPGGIHCVGQQLFIANTNAHQVIRVDLTHATAEVVDVHE